MHKLLSQLCDDARRFEQRGWLAGTAGNLSARDVEAPDALCHVSQSGLCKGRLTPKHFIAFNLSTRQKRDANDPRKPSDEAALHACIYHHVPEAQVIYHVHSPCATWLSRHTPGPWLEMPRLEMMKGLGLPDHLTPSRLLLLENSQTMEEIMQLLAPHLTAAETPFLPGVLIRGHGLYAWGASPAAARRHVEIFEFVFQQMMWDKRVGM